MASIGSGVILNMRLAKCHNSVAFAPQKILTIPIYDECNTSSYESSSSEGVAADPYGQYVLTNSAMRTWGYPVAEHSTNCRLTNEEGTLHRKRSYEKAMMSFNEEVHQVSDCGPTPADWNGADSMPRLIGVLEGSHFMPSLLEATYRFDRYNAESMALVVPPVDIFASASIVSGADATADLQSEGQVCTDAVDEIPTTNELEESSEEAAKNNYEIYRVTLDVKDVRKIYGGGLDGIGAGGALGGSNLRIYDVVALDCEMCDTMKGLELTRLSMLDGNGKVILDTLIKPYDDITNYREQFSGLNAGVLDCVNVRFEQAQLAFLRIVSNTTTLIGHSLENDLKALKICHGRCVDTAVIFPHPRGYPLRHKLRFLAKEYLHVDIQKGGSGIVSGAPITLGLPTVSAVPMLGPSGHSSVEDARVALQLVRLKIENGPSFGVRAVMERREPLVAHLPLPVRTSFIWGSVDSMTGMRACVDGRGSAMKCRDNSNALKKCVNLLLKQSQDPDVLNHRSLVHLGLDCQEWNAPNHVASEVESGASNCTVDDMVQNSISEITKALSSSAPNRGTLLIVSTQTAVKAVAELQRRKAACMKALSASVWTAELEDVLKYNLQQAALSSVYLGIYPRHM